MSAKYLFVINSFAAGGAERSLLEVLPRLVSDGVTPILACLTRGDVGFEDEVRAAGYDLRLLAGNPLRKVRTLRRIIRTESPALVHTTLFDADVTGRLAAAGLAVPVITSLVNTTYDPVRLADPNITAWKLRVVRAIDVVTSQALTDHFHAVSHAVKDSAVSTMGLKPEKIRVVMRGRDEERLGQRTPERRQRIRAELGLADDDELIVTVGRQEFQKGQVHLIEAMPGIIAARPGVRLLIVGRPGHASAGLEGSISALGVGDSVSLLGHRPDVSDILSAADLFVFPSVYEGLGGAVIEALALSLPIVASDLPALREVLEEGENAVLVPPGDPTALEGAVVGLLEDRARLDRFGERSRRLFEASFRSEDATEAMVGLLADVSGVAPAVDDAAITEVLAAMSGRSGVLAQGNQWSVEGEWPSFKARFVEAVNPSGSRIAVKFGTNWDPGHPEFVAAEIERVRPLFRNLPGGPVRMPAALGWTSDPPALVLEFVRGTELFEWLAQSGETHPGTMGTVALCGQAVGAYHSAQPADPEDSRAAEAALSEFMAAARRAGVRRQVALAVEPRLVRSRGYRFSPNDFVLDADGHLVMLDPPHVEKYDYIHRDVSAFFFELHRALIGDRAVPAKHPRAALLADTRAAFLAGYRATGPEPLDRPLDEWAIRLFELARITGRINGELRRRRTRHLPGLARWAASERRKLGGPPPEVN